MPESPTMAGAVAHVAVLLGWVVFLGIFLLRRPDPVAETRKSDRGSLLGVAFQALGFAAIGIARRPRFTPIAPVPPMDPAFMTTAEAGTGTVMGAPVAPALYDSARPPAPYGQPPAGGTMRAPPIERPMHEPSAAYTSHPTGTRTRAPSRSGNGLIFALAAIALLLGAGAVVAYVMTTSPTTQAAVVEETLAT